MHCVVCHILETDSVLLCLNFDEKFYFFAIGVFFAALSALLLDDIEIFSALLAEELLAFPAEFVSSPTPPALLLLMELAAMLRP
mmetsp:Transcript_19971/g.21705  ORF Transcript_19971/g.21705 Transcript_19971/m.21705 type:complete len:84 (+) Transcript_19971:52-303(+)